MAIHFKDTYLVFYEKEDAYSIWFDVICNICIVLKHTIIKKFVVHIIVVFFPNGEMIKGNDNKWYIFDITVVSARL